MGLVSRFAPPAFLSDFNSIPGQLEAWHRAISNWFDGSIESDRPLVPDGIFQFFNPSTFDPGGIEIEQAVTWNAFPKELLRRFGRERAMEEADTLWALERYYSELNGVRVDRNKYPSLFTNFFRPQNEYCEWHVSRNSNTGAILNVTFTSEPPEFWHALFGGTVPEDPNQFPGDKDVLLQRYREFISPDVQLDDLVAQEDIRGPQGAFALKGHYNPYNKWNTTHGAVHLGAPPNSLTAEIQLGADATVLRKNGKGALLVEADALICCAAYGGPDRNSDPTIGATVNALARAGAFVTLRNPVGLYMDHIDLSGWEVKDGKGIADCIKITRGTLGMIERLVVEVPKDRGLTVSDITIGGVPIEYGGQIAECITVKLVGVAHPQANIKNQPTPCDGHCCIDAAYPRSLRRHLKIDQDVPPGTVPAFENQGASESSPVVVESAVRVPSRQIRHATHVFAARRRIHLD